MSDLMPVILAGGSGTRLWPLSRETLPKQLLRLPGEDVTLLQATAQRLMALAPASRILTVGMAAQDLLVRRQLGQVDPDLVGQRLLEPTGRNTAGAVALAALFARDRNAPGTVLFVCPSDHMVGQPDVLAAAVRAALPAAIDGEVVTFGINPTRPETGYGYIQAGAPRADAQGVLNVVRFVEKPTRPVAEVMLAEGGHFWNAGIFLFRADRILEELETHAPEVLETVARAYEQLEPVAPDGFIVPEAAYREVPSVPIDKAVMERTERIAIVPCEPDWSDLGSWQALWERLPRDGYGNATAGPVFLDRTSGCLVQAETRLIGCAGVEDLAVIETGDAILVAGRGQSDSVRSLVGALKTARRSEASHPVVITEPWGARSSLQQRNGIKVEEVVIDPGAELVIKSEHRSSCHWVVTAGAADVGIDGTTRRVLTEESFDVPAGQPVTIGNAGEGPLRMIEVRFWAPS